jgi:hypothetical protein
LSSYTANQMQAKPTLVTELKEQKVGGEEEKKSR